MNKEKILELIEELKHLVLQQEEQSLILEDSNFRISSEGWIRLGEVLENPEKDIWEIFDGKYKGEQLFTWDAAMRETEKAGKRMPTKEEFEKLFTDKIPEFPLAGNRNHSSAALIYQGSYGYYWSSSPNGSYAYNLFFSSSAVSPASYSYRAYGFSVRCVKD